MTEAEDRAALSSRIDAVCAKLDARCMKVRRKQPKTRTKAETYARYRQITLDYMTGMSYAEICQKHGVTQMTVVHALKYCGAVPNRRKWTR